MDGCLEIDLLEVIDNSYLYILMIWGSQNSEMIILISYSFIVWDIIIKHSLYIKEGINTWLFILFNRFKDNKLFF